MNSFKLWGAVSLILVLSVVLLSATAFASDGNDIAPPTVQVSDIDEPRHGDPPGATPAPERSSGPYEDWPPVPANMRSARPSGHGFSCAEHLPQADSTQLRRWRLDRHRAYDCKPADWAGSPAETCRHPRPWLCPTPLPLLDCAISRSRSEQQWFPRWPCALPQSGGPPQPEQVS